MVNSFLQYLQYEKRYSQHTVAAYQLDISQFALYLSTTYELNQPELADYTMIRSWIVSMVEKREGSKPMEARTVNRKIATLRTFYKFLLRKKAISQDPTVKVRALKTNRALPSFVEEHPINTLLDGIEFSPDFTGIRDRLIIEILYGTGIRLSELIHLKDSHISVYEQMIKVTGKRNKERIVPVHKSLLKLITTYQESKKATFGSNRSATGESAQPSSSDDFLIVTDKGEQSYPMMIQRIVKKYLDLITTIETRSPHVLRHTFATHLLNKGADLNAIKDLLGHTSLAATQVYTHNSIDKLKKIFEQAHPKA